MQDFFEALPALMIAIAGGLIGLFIGTAFAPLAAPATGLDGARLRTALTTANGDTNWGVWGWLFGKPSSRRSSSGNDPWDTLVVAGVGGILAVTLYVKWVDVVANTLIVMSAAAVLTATISLWTLWRRDVVDGRLFAYRTVTSMLIATIGILNAVWAIYPPLHPDYIRAMQAVVAGHHVQGLSWGDTFGFLLLQLVGQVITAVTLLNTSAYAIAAVAAIYLDQRAMGRWFWLFSFWTVRWSVPRPVFWPRPCLGLFRCC